MRKKPCLCSARQLHRVVEKNLLFGPKHNQVVIGPQRINEAHKQAMPLFLCFFWMTASFVLLLLIYSLSTIQRAFINLIAQALLLAQWFFFFAFIYLISLNRRCFLKDVSFLACWQTSKIQRVPKNEKKCFFVPFFFLFDKLAAVHLQHNMFF